MSTNDYIMLKFFKKNIKAKSLKKGNEKQISKKSAVKNSLTPDQSINTAIEKLDATISNIKNKENKQPKQKNSDKQKLIKNALAIQKSKSKLLDDLDEETRRRLKTLALELMVIKRNR